MVLNRRTTLGDDLKRGGGGVVVAEGEGLPDNWIQPDRNAPCRVQVHVAALFDGKRFSDTRQADVSELCLQLFGLILF